MAQRRYASLWFIAVLNKGNSMADNFLERQRQDYEARKAVWLKNKKHLTRFKRVAPQPPEDEAL